MNKKTIKECLTCGKEFESYISANKKYCSKTCANRRQSKQITYHDFICENCGKTFQRTGRQVRNMNHKGHEIKYCSIKCKQEAWGKTRKETTCPICGTVFLMQARLWHENSKYTCSPECAKLNPDNRTIWKKHMLTIKCNIVEKILKNLNIMSENKISVDKMLYIVQKNVKILHFLEKILKNMESLTH